MVALREMFLGIRGRLAKQAQDGNADIDVVLCLSEPRNVLVEARLLVAIESVADKHQHVRLVAARELDRDRDGPPVVMRRVDVWDDQTSDWFNWRPPWIEVVENIRATRPSSSVAEGV